MIASGKGRSFGGFFFLALFTTPLIGLIAAACAMPATGQPQPPAAAQGAHPTSSGDETKRCWYCAERIQSAARNCRFCDRLQPSD